MSSPPQLHLPYVADENHDEDPEVQLACETADSVSQRIKEAFLAKGRPVGSRPGGHIVT